MTVHHWFDEVMKVPESCFEAGEVDIWIEGDKVTVKHDNVHVRAFPLELLEQFIATHKAEIARRAAE